MAPPGRRRAGLSFLSACFLLLFISHTTNAAAAVLGVDLGTEYIKAVLVKPGMPLEIVLSPDSKRKEPAVVAFKTPRGVSETERVFPERSYGSEAQALVARYPSDVYGNLKQLLGLPADTSSIVKEYQSRNPELSLVKTEGRGTVSFKSRSFKYGETPFAVEELLAMVLKKVIANAQTLAGKTVKVKSVVFTVPPFYTIEEKSALEMAAELAGVNVLGLISDGLAVGTNYATSRKFESIDKGGNAENHMVFDVGAGYTVATVLTMQGRDVKDVGKFNKTIQEVIVKGTGWDRSLGGDAMNKIILQDMAAKFVESPKGSKLGKTAQDLLSNGRAVARLWKDAEKLRQVLSANQQSTASIEELYEDVAFKYKLTRAEFEAQTETFAERLAAPFNDALKAAKLTAADIDSVILHGGAIRTPFIQKKLEALVGDKEKIRSNVNSDEAAAFGAAFKAAGLSPSFRVKEIRGYDATVYPTWIEYKNEAGKIKQQKLFTPSSFVGASKVITLPNKEDFEIYMYQKRPTDSGSPFEGSEAANSGTKYQTKSLTEHVAKLIKDHNCKSENITTKITLRLNPVWGLPEVHSGSVSCDYEAPDKAGVMDNVKDFLGFGKKEDDGQKVLKDDAKDKKSSSKSKSSSSSSSSSAADAKSSDKTDAKSDKDKVSKTKTETKTLKFEFEAKHDDSTVIPWVEQKFIAERIRSFDQSDSERVTRLTNRNDLEFYLLRARDLVEDNAFTKFGSVPMIKDINKIVKSTLTWLSDNMDAKSEAYVEKLKAVTDLVDPIKQRRSDAEGLPEQTEMLRTILDQSKSMIGIIRDTIESASKSAASLAEEASKTAEEVASSASSAVVGEESADPLADLEHDEPSSSSSSSAAAKPSPPPEFAYTREDLKGLNDAYESVESWLTEKLAAQEKLKAWEDSVVRPGDLKKKGQELNDALMKMLQKKLKSQKSQNTFTKEDIRKAEKAAKEALAKARARAKQGADNVKSQAADASDIVKDKAGEAAESVKSGASIASESVKSGASVASESVSSGASVASESLSSGASVAKESVESGASVASESVSSASEEVKTKIKDEL